MRRIFLVLLLLTATLCSAIERQSNADYRARRQALAARTNGGAVVLFAATEAEGPNALYGFRQDDNFYYLTGWAEPGGALLIAPAVEAKGSSPARPYTEVFFLPQRNATQERWTGPKLGPGDAKAPEITGFDRVLPVDAMRDELARILPQPRAAVYTDVREAGEAASPSAVGVE
ncbi:MAG: aminopeptidase P N-terminal domain-containing protein, partial [Terriglobales bacterium]